MRRTDRILWLLCLALSGFSILLLFGIIDTGYAGYLRISNRNILVQGVAVVMGACGAALLSHIDYKNLAKLWKVHVPVSYFLLALTFFMGVGTLERPDDRRWLIFPLGGLSFQPSELLRISFILVFAYHIFCVREKINHPLHLPGLLVHGAVPVILLHLQGDDGSALIIAAIFISMLFCSGISWKYIFGTVAIIGVSLPVLWSYILSDFQKQRFLAVYYGADRDIQGIFFQQHRAQIAFATGGEGGVGIFNASHIYVPEMHNDFMFSFLGASTGFVGCALTIVAIIVLWLKILLCAGRAKDLLGSMICMGIFSMLSFQTLINIGMNIAMLPVIGNPLPFLSYGGSSMLTSYLGIGLVLSVHMHSSKPMFE